MDHLPWSDDLFEKRPIVPYICSGYEHNIPDEIDTFIDWPELQGWTLDSECSLEELATKCQAWLFFGLIRVLSHLAGEKFDLNDYILEIPNDFMESSHFPPRPVPDFASFLTPAATPRYQVDSTQISKLVSKALLPPIKWYEYVADLKSRRDKNRQRLRPLLKSVVGPVNIWISKIMRRIDTEFSDSDPWTYPLFNVFWSTMMLLDLLIDASHSITARESLESPSGQSSSSNLRNADGEAPQNAQPLFTNRSIILANALEKLGKCPTALQRTKMSFLETFQLFSISGGSRTSHMRCEGLDCRGYSITEATYRMHHTEPCSNGIRQCRLLRIDSESLKQLIQEERTPVVRSRLVRGTSLEISIVDGTDNLDVVAVSHIWAGGLGHFKENAHYECQLMKLHMDLTQQPGKARASSSTVHYWLDTLCVPATQCEHKTIAINRMAATYARCKSVLVVDPELSKLDSSRLNPKQLTLALLSCPWMGRSWTLQEGALSVKLNLLFANKILSFTAKEFDNDLIRDTTLQSLWKADSNQWSREYMFKFFLMFDGTKMEDFKHIDENLEAGEWFLAVWNSLCKRTSTKLDDLALILAVLLGRSAGEMIPLTRTQRVMSLLATQKYLPVSLLFVPTENDIDTWCPLLPNSHGQSNLLSDNGDFMGVTEDGCFEITTPDTITLLRCQNQAGTRNLITVHDQSTDTHYSIRAPGFSHQPTSSFKGDIYLLFQQGTRRTSSGHGKIGLCFVVVGEDPSKFRLRFMQSFRWHVEDPQHDLSEDVLGRDTQLLTTFFDRRDSSSRASNESARISKNSPLLLDMGITPAPSLKWSRQAYYPIAATSLHVNRMLNLLLILPVPSFIYLFIYLAMICVDYTYTVRSFLVYLLPGSFILLAVYKAINLEYAWYRKYLRQRLQQIWASSFDSATLEKDQLKLFPAEVYKYFVLLLVAQITILCSGLLVIFTLWKTSKLSFGTGLYDTLLERVVDLLFPRMNLPPWLLITYPLLPFIAITLSSRILALTFARVWHVQQDPRTSATPKQSTNFETTPFDPQYDWAFTFFRIIGLFTIAPLLIAFIYSMGLEIVGFRTDSISYFLDIIKRIAGDKIGTDLLLDLAIAAGFLILVSSIIIAAIIALCVVASTLYFLSSNARLRLWFKWDAEVPKNVQSRSGLAVLFPSQLDPAGNT